ncbi:unnamed protein product [Urochloa humidicola]
MEDSSMASVAIHHRRRSGSFASSSLWQVERTDRAELSEISSLHRLPEQLRSLERLTGKELVEMPVQLRMSQSLEFL